MFAYCGTRYNVKMKTATSYRLSPEALDLIKRLAEELGISQAAVIEISVRMFSKSCEKPLEKK